MKIIPEVPFFLELAEQNTNGCFRIASLFIRLRENSGFRRKKFFFFLWKRRDLLHKIFEWVDGFIVFVLFIN